MELVGFGFDLNTVLALDVESFDILVARTHKIAAQQQVEALWQMFVAAQGDKNAVKKMAEALVPKPLEDRAREDSAKLRQMFGGQT